MKKTALSITAALIVIAVGCVFQRGNSELREYLTDVDDIEEEFTSGIETNAEKYPWVWGLEDPPADLGFDETLRLVQSSVSESFEVTERACSSARTLEPPAQAVDFNQSFTSLLCDYSDANRSLLEAVRQGDLSTLLVLSSTANDFERRADEVGKERERLGKLAD